MTSSEHKPQAVSKEPHVIALVEGTIVPPADVDPLWIQAPDGRCLLKVRADGSQEWRTEDASELISIMVKELLSTGERYRLMQESLLAELNAVRE